MKRNGGWKFGFALCVFASGVSCLVHEVVWLRLIETTSGASLYSIGLVLGAVMGGFAVGGRLGLLVEKRLRDRCEAMRCYGATELLIGVSAVGVLPILMTLKPFYAVVYRACAERMWLYDGVSAGLSALVLLVPASLMGATFPFMCRVLAGGAGRAGRQAGLVYGLNTLGGAVGALLAGFWLVNVLGVREAILVAGCTNVVVGGICLAIARWGRVDCGEVLENRPVDERTSGAQGDPGMVAGLLGLIAISGFCAMGYEVIWTRLLSLLIGPTTYAFSLVLVVFILGLALGSFLFARVADRVVSPVGCALTVQVACAALVLAVSQVLGSQQFFFAKLLYEHRNDFWALQLATGLVVFGVLLPVTLLLGGVFPLVARGVGQASGAVGSGAAAGRSYVWNTVGGVLGSLITGFLLIRWLGMATAVSVLATAQALAVAPIAMRCVRGSAWRLAAVGSALVVAVAAVAFPEWDALLLAEGRYHRFERIEDELGSLNYREAVWEGNGILKKLRAGEDLLYVGDGVGGFTTVSRSVNTVGATNLMLSLSGKLDASSRVDRNTQVLSAHIPMLLHPRAKRAMVLGLASGMTAGEMLVYPLERLDVLEVNPQVVEAAAWFEGVNNRVLKDPRTRVRIQDGRAHLALSGEKYDVISSEPSNPWMAGLASLYTKEFFSAARASLNPGGIFVQFMHAYQMDWSTFSMVGRTLCEVFPECMAFETSPGGSDLLFVGFQDRARIDLPVVRSNMAYTARSKLIRFGHPGLLHELLLTDRVKEGFGPGPVHCDHYPLLEYSAPRLLHAAEVDLVGLLRRRGGYSKEVQETRQAQVDGWLQVTYLQMLVSIHSNPFGIVDPDKIPSGYKAGITQALSAYAMENEILSYGELSDGERAAVIPAQRVALMRNLTRCVEGEGPTGRGLVPILDAMGRLSWAMGEFKDAVGLLVKAVEIDPDDTALMLRLAAAYEAAGQQKEAASVYTRAKTLGVRSVDGLLRIAAWQARQGDVAGTAELLELALARRPDDGYALLRLAEVRLKESRFSDAAALARRSVAADPEREEGYECLAYSEWKCGRRIQALQAVEQGLALAPNNARLATIRGKIVPLSMPAPLSDKPNE